MVNDYVAKSVKVKGLVQGVGFRPFVYHLANRYGLKGKVANTSSGVSIHIEGPSKEVENFCHALAKSHPELSHITDISMHFKVVKGFKKFKIAQSTGLPSKSALISPDVSVCHACLLELFDPQNRRYRYPFINCTNCGPRHTIIHDIPYDRSNTTMRHFDMCEKCKAEYRDPGNRRFHAQPNACSECGPRVTLYDRNRRIVPSRDPLENAAALLRHGFVFAIKGLGGFHLAVDAENDQAIARLRWRKHREEKPFAVMSYDIHAIRKYAHVGIEEEKLLESSQRPIVIVRKKEPHPLSDDVSPRNSHFGVMLPYTPLHYVLLSHDFTALVMTSGNISEEPMIIDNEDAFEQLSQIADFFLMHDRDIYLRSDDSIVRHTNGKARFIRLSRGYVPVPIPLKRRVPQIIACGAQLKNTVCLTKGNNAFLSQHIGDLENLSTYRFYESTITHMRRILDIHPRIAAHDFHPDYMSTRYAGEQRDLKRIPVQHHHAHIASCMAENLLNGPVIGMSFDGTGYGTDGNLWGGEIFVGTPEKFSRAAHLAYVPMPGGAAAIKAPWRMAVSYLYDAFGERFWNLDLPLLKELEEKKIRIILDMISKKVNSPNTSSMGRFFDGVASIVGLRNVVSYEGQAAIELETMAKKKLKTIYDYEWVSGEVHRGLPQPIVTGLVRDLEKGIPVSEISGKFHMTLIHMFSKICRVIRKERGLNRVLLSGGVFQNALLLTGLTRALENNGFQVFAHHLVPTNDGGISLGQAMVAAAVSGR